MDSKKREAKREKQAARKQESKKQKGKVSGLKKTIGTHSDFDKKLTAEEQDFAALQAHWYKKLESSGFDDIEWVDHKSGYGHDAPFRKKALSQLRTKYSPATEEHFRRCRIFISHYKFDDPVKERLMHWHTEGLSMRDIVKKIKWQVERYPGSIFKKAYSLYWVHVHLNEVLDFMRYWHYMDEEGLDNPANEDFYIEDFAIKPLQESSE